METKIRMEVAEITDSSLERFRDSLYEKEKAYATVKKYVRELEFITAEAVLSGRAEISMKGKNRIVILPEALRKKLKSYMKEAGSWVSIGSGAEVTLDGGADTDAERDGASWYEYDGWKAVWMNVPESMPGSLLDAEGKTQYRIVETVPGGYIQVDSGTDVVEEGGNEYTEYTFINSKSVTVAAEKVWYADSDQQQEVTAALYRTTGSAGDGNSEQVTDSDGSPVTLKLNASNSWKASVSNLPKYDENGEEYIYYVRETEIGGSGELSGFRILYEDEGKAGDNAFSTVITNIQRTELEVTKIWKDNADLYGTRPEDVELILWRSTEENPDPENAGDWEQVTEETLDAEGASLSESWTKADDEWYFSFTGLPAYSSKGETYTYRVSEAEISLPEDAAAGAGDGYEASWDAETGTLTNTLTGTTEVTVTKKSAEGAAGTIEGGSTSEASFENYKPGSEDGDGGSSSGSSGSSSTSQAGGAETGDSKSPGIWIALILLSAGCITGILLYTRKIKSEKTQNRSE